ncbi:hypothetical protein C7414_103380 [Cupriavidus alkaliphilus]|nr:hypothetical protein C7414_103380 [Cupriavidus alkaliphilus]
MGGTNGAAGITTTGIIITGITTIATMATDTVVITAITVITAIAATGTDRLAGRR